MRMFAIFAGLLVFCCYRLLATPAEVLVGHHRCSLSASGGLERKDYQFGVQAAMCNRLVRSWAYCRPCCTPLTTQQHEHLASSRDADASEECPK